MHTRSTRATIALAFCAAVAILASGLATASDEPAHAIALDDLLDITPGLDGEPPRWSPTGEELLFVAGGRLRLADPGSGSVSTLDADLGGAGHFLASAKPRFSPDGETISFISARSGNPELWLWSLQAGEQRQLTRLGGRINAYAWSPDGARIAFSGDRHGRYDIWTVDVQSGRVVRVTAGEGYEVYPSWTPDGAEILYVALDERWVDHTIHAVPADGGPARTLLRDTDFFDYQAGGRFGYPSVSPDGERVLFRSHRNGWRNYWTVPIAGGEPSPVAAEPADQKGARWSPDGRHVAFTALENGTHVLRVAEVGAPDNVRTVASPPDGLGVIAAPDWSPDGRYLGYTLETPASPRDLFVVSLDNGDTLRITDARPAPDASRRLVTPRKLVYPSSDGFEIPAYLYMPPAEARDGPVPALLWIHGGPTSQFHDSFQPHVQYFVQRGYAVLMPNIRGSSGYGRAFEAANERCWGRCDLEDVLAGVDYLRGLDSIDPWNIGITGTSYGGIMSMAAPAFAPGVFQAAVPISGYADYVHLTKEQELRHVKLLEFELGPLEDNRELYEHLSAIHYVAEVDTPFLVINGRGYFPESEAGDLFVAELERHYKPVRHLVFEDENYYVRGRENRARMLREMLAFFDQHLGGHRIDFEASAGYEGEP